MVTTVNQPVGCCWCFSFILTLYGCSKYTCKYPHIRSPPTHKRTHIKAQAPLSLYGFTFHPNFVDFHHFTPFFYYSRSHSLCFGALPFFVQKPDVYSLCLKLKLPRASAIHSIWHYHAERRAFLHRLRWWTCRHSHAYAITERAQANERERDLACSKLEYILWKLETSEKLLHFRIMQTSLEKCVRHEIQIRIARPRIGRSLSSLYIY